MKRKVFILLFLLLIPIKTFALEEKEYNVCKNGCEYSELETVFNEIENYTSTDGYNVVINVLDQETYDAPSQVTLNDAYTRDSEVFNRLTNLTINGNGASLNTNDRNILIGTEEKVTIKHLKIESKTIVICSRGDEVLFEDTNIEAKNISAACSSISKVTVKDSTFKGNFGGINIAVKNLDSEGELSLSNPISVEDIEVKGTLLISTKIPEPITIKNINIDANHNEYGLSIYYDVCRGEDPDYVLENITVKNADVAAVHRMRNHGNLTIKNSDLSDNACSIHLESLGFGSCVASHSKSPKTELKLLSDRETNPDTVFQDSKVCCAKSYKGDTASHGSSFTMAGGPTDSIMYFDKTNIWTKPISRGEGENDNVIEKDNNSILIEQTNQDVISLNVEKGVDLSKYFEWIANDIEWTVEDESILSIINNQIIPKKAGETNIVGRSAKDVYYLNIRITGEKNPNTVTNLKVIIGLICLLLLLEITIHFGKKKARE